MPAMPAIPGGSYGAGAQPTIGSGYGAGAPPAMGGFGMGGGAPMPGAPGFGPQLQQTNQNAANYMNSALQSALGTGPQQSYSIGSLEAMGRPQQQISAAVMPPQQQAQGAQPSNPGLMLQDQIQAMQRQQQGLPLGTQQVPQYPGSLSDPGTQRMIQDQAQGLQRQQAMMSQMPGTMGNPQQNLQSALNAQQQHQAMLRQLGAVNQQQQEMQNHGFSPEAAQAYTAFGLQQQQAARQFQSQFDSAPESQRAAMAAAFDQQRQDAYNQFVQQNPSFGQQMQRGVEQVQAQLPSPTQQPPALSRTQQLGMDARAQAELNRQNIATMQQNMGPRSNAPMYTPPASPAQPIQAQPVQAQPLPYHAGPKAGADFGGRQQMPQYQSPRPSMPQRPQMSQSGPFSGGGLGALNANQQALMQRFGRTGG